MATHFSIVAWSIPWRGELGGLQSMGCKESDTTERSTAIHILVTQQFSTLLNIPENFHTGS